jgi:glycosyltransferase involved in cell wall biosynthesis
MRIAIIAPPFIAVPPTAYGGTELFIAHLAESLVAAGQDVVVYANGASRVRCELRSLYPESCWPPVDATSGYLRNADHTAWALADAAKTADVIHLNDAIGLPMTRLTRVPVLLTLHHPHEPVLSAFYEQYPAIHYVAISAAQARRERMPRMSVVHHGVHTDSYRFSEAKEDYVAFLGRIVPCKGAHTAIAVARRAGLRLKIAGERQPMYEAYWREQVMPHIDGDQIQYLGEADEILKNELLSGARALLFPIEWDEPFGLVMIEALACGTPVLAFEGGSVAEIVRNGVNGWICRDVGEMAGRAAAPDISPHACLASVRGQFSCERMASRYLDVYRRVQASGAPRPIAVEAGAPWKM